MRPQLIAAVLAALSPPALFAPALAAPADVARAVAAKDRAEADIQLDASRKPAEVLGFLGLEKGDRALDLMAGGGYYSEIMARAVGPKGFVVAWNPPGFAASDRVKTAWAGIRTRNRNVSAFVMPLPEIALAPASYDFAMLHLVYHDAYWESAQFNFARVDPDVVLAKLYRAMKPGGIVGVVDHVGNPGDTRAIVEATHRIDPATIKADFARAGFVLDGESDVLRVEGDDYAKSVFDPALRGRTDRVVYRFVRPAGGGASTDGGTDGGAGGGCDASKVSGLAGQRLDDGLRAKAEADSGARQVRSYRTGDPVTMDYRPDRLNIETDQGGMIVRLTCG
jgi:predicted methyltransferase